MEEMMSLAQQSTTFLHYLEDWLASLPSLTLDEAIPQPEKSVLITADVINGLLYEGSLSSPRVATIQKPITNLMTEVWERGMRDKTPVHVSRSLSVYSGLMPFVV